MTYAYLLTVQGLMKGTGEMHSVIGIYSSREKAVEALEVAEGIIGRENLFHEDLDGTHEGAELSIKVVELDKVYHIKKSGDLVTTDMLIGGTIVM